MILSFIRAFRHDEHVLVFNNLVPTWITAELRSHGNVRGHQIEGRDFAGLVDEHRPDVVFFHWYPPMSCDDFLSLPKEVLRRSIVYNHWYTDVPYIDEVNEFWFLSPTSMVESGRGIPPDKSRVLLNPVRGDSSRSSGAPSRSRS